MAWTDILLLIMMGALGVVACKTDLTRGMVYNRHLLIFFAIGVVADIFYYGLFHQDMIIPFVMNLAVVTIIPQTAEKWNTFLRIFI